LLRYRTGDLVLARPLEPCECGGHQLALDGGILSRADDMVVVRGVNVYPGAVDALIRSCGGVAEYCVYVTTRQSMAELNLTIEPESHDWDATALKSHLEQSFQSAMALRVSITLVPPGTLPRYEMKAKRWMKG
jgi:phenylacetate-CoA ligase